MVVVVDGVRLVAKSSCIDVKSVRRVGRKSHIGVRRIRRIRRVSSDAEVDKIEVVNLTTFGRGSRDFNYFLARQSSF